MSNPFGDSAIYFINNTLPVDPLRPLGTADYTATSILNRIYATVNNMVNTMQNVTAAETGRTQLLTTWQTAYTVKMNQLHTFTSVDGSSDTSDLNSLNTKYLQNLQNRQSVLNNTLKALQSNIDQSNSAVNTQSTQGTSIIQTLSTLLSSTFS